MKGYSSAQSKSDDSVVSRSITIAQFQRGEVFLVSCGTEFSREALGLGFNSMMGRFLVSQPCTALQGGSAKAAAFS